MTEKKPTLEQQAAIDYPGSMVAVAKPGSGKTFTIARKISKILEDLSVHRGVIAISYTNKASDELKSRVAAQNGMRSRSFFGTINRFCESEITIPFLPHIWGMPVEKLSVIKIRELSDDVRASLDGLGRAELSLEELEENLTSIRSLFLQGKLLLEASGALALFTFRNSSACRRYLF